MSSEASLLLAGIVIGLVIIISCITIIIGRLRKGNHKRNPNLRSSSLVGDRYFVGSNGELRPIRPDDSRTASDWDSYAETVSQISDMCPDAPPQYDECMESRAPPMYEPAEAPPPYSVTDPFRWDHPSSPRLHHAHYDLQMELLPDSSAYPIRQRHFRAWSVASIPPSPLPLEEAPPYEAVVGEAESDRPIPLTPQT
ncbi:protein BEAN1 [Astyanax mexicanus]|uniref:Protein BEAN1 n=1 Tax=Astyanax mexicanus TaxID=7994 RepID=A0A8B9H473_ASTMX|nr:protein BEAN1 [Astyanax mexicanus]XP_049327269.1 protein BEAN1 [Astyanax mexicanus]KAG9261207.1 protein BEAN1 [Astyanax mexicanus]